ncbi:MAG: hypothetical protein ACRD1R_05785 [Acidobacteriota bacterium]
MRTAVFLASLLASTLAYGQKGEKPNIQIPSEWSQPYPAEPSGNLESARACGKT